MRNVQDRPPKNMLPLKECLFNVEECAFNVNTRFQLITFSYLIIKSFEIFEWLKGICPVYLYLKRYTTQGIYGFCQVC